MIQRSSRARRRPSKPLLVSMLAFPQAQILDVTGPLEVFARTSRWLRQQGLADGDAYRVEILAARAGPFPTSSGMRLVADRAFGTVKNSIDTLLVSGGVGTETELHNRRLLAWLARQAERVRRLCSVCTGALLLAEAGLLDRRSATTHWNYCGRLAKRSGVRVEPDRIFVRDGNIYTSAGVTAGMDLALALVEEDHGRDVALSVARELVMFLRRPGGQSQFSAQLAGQIALREPLRDVQSFIHDNPTADLSVPALALRTSMSERNFSRAFSREVGRTPASYVERARVETARRLLEESTLGLKEVAARSGFGSMESMRRAFRRGLGVPPTAYRQRFSHERRAPR
ncbi:MAG: DJ-1/PfpI family protein [Planctomycetes bacterium]|nr:DJ-1/PfpI family protein [Planctomycetota bacterium]